MMLTYLEAPGDLRVIEIPLGNDIQVVVEVDEEEIELAQGMKPAANMVPGLGITLTITGKHGKGISSPLCRIYGK
jgi:hypothetical protein